MNQNRPFIAPAITTDGRKLATDARMLSATAPDFAESKINRTVEDVASMLNTTQGVDRPTGQTGRERTEQPDGAVAGSRRRPMVEREGLADRSH